MACKPYLNNCVRPSLADLPFVTGPRTEERRGRSHLSSLKRMQVSCARDMGRVQESTAEGITVDQVCGPLGQQALS